MAHPCRGVRAALLTRHGKSLVIGPILRDGLDIEVVETDAYDTDRLGTFSGEIERTLSPLDCARRKAELAIETTGLAVGLGSEGSFGPGPLGPLGTWNTELIVWYDAPRGWTIVGRAQGPCSVRRSVVHDIPSALDFARQTPAGQALIVSSGSRYYKALYGLDAVSAAATACRELDPQTPLTLHFDLRAQHSPERRARIGAAARDLLRRLLSLCPRCGRPDFCPDLAIAGLPCADCGEPTQETRERLARCAACEQEARYPVPDVVADPQYCAACNP